MIQLNDILEQWKTDSLIEMPLDESSKQTPKLHAKYLELLSLAKFQLKKSEMEQKVLLKDKWLYYNGKLSEEEIKENESYEMLLERWKRRVGQERIESWSRKLDGVVREQVLNTPIRKSHGDDRSKVKRQMSVPITPKRNQDEDLRIALQLSREDSEKVERDHDVLLARLDAFGLREKVVSGDGNCQFRALSDQLFRTPEFYEEVRKNVVGQLRKHASRYAAYVVAANEEGGSKNSLPHWPGAVYGVSHAVRI